MDQGAQREFAKIQCALEHTRAEQKSTNCQPVAVVCHVTRARLSYPTGVAVDTEPGRYRLIIADSGNHCIRAVDLTASDLPVQM